ncbi:MAG: hypothetical protein AAFR11_08790 [Pseudomonadota bacterium]
MTSIDESTVFKDDRCAVTERAALHLQSLRSNIAYELWASCDGTDPELLAQTWDPEFFSLQIENTPGVARIVVFFCPGSGDEERADFQQNAARFTADHADAMKARLVAALDPGSCPGASSGPGSASGRRQSFRSDRRE